MPGSDFTDFGSRFEPRDALFDVHFIAFPTV